MADAMPHPKSSPDRARHSAEPLGSCLFCDIARGAVPSHMVLEDEGVVAFLDHRPLFHGHCLLVPRAHVETLEDLPDALLEPLFRHTRRLARAVQAGMKADGTFVAINNRVSQSVPHLHVHVVPRRRGDGLKGFFWPRQRYAGLDEIEQVGTAIRNAMA